MLDCAMFAPLTGSQVGRSTAHSLRVSDTRLYSAHGSQMLSLALWVLCCVVLCGCVCRGTVSGVSPRWCTCGKSIVGRVGPQVRSGVVSGRVLFASTAVSALRAR